MYYESMFVKFQSNIKKSWDLLYTFINKIKKQKQKISSTVNSNASSLFPLHHVISLSLSSGIIPTQLKVAMVNPVFKS